MTTKQQKQERQTFTDNIQLALAAPELLEAAQFVISELKNITTEGFRCGADKPFRDKLEVAIAKATRKEIKP